MKLLQTSPRTMAPPALAPTTGVSQQPQISQATPLDMEWVRFDATHYPQTAATRRAVRDEYLRHDPAFYQWRAKALQAQPPILQRLHTEAELDTHLRNHQRDYLVPHFLFGTDRLEGRVGWSLFYMLLGRGFGQTVGNIFFNGALETSAVIGGAIFPSIFIPTMIFLHEMSEPRYTHKLYNNPLVRKAVAASVLSAFASLAFYSSGIVAGETAAGLSSFISGFTFASTALIGGQWQSFKQRLSEFTALKRLQKLLHRSTTHDYGVSHPEKIPVLSARVIADQMELTKTKLREQMALMHERIEEIEREKALLPTDTASLEIDREITHEGDYLDTLTRAMQLVVQEIEQLLVHLDDPDTDTSASTWDIQRKLWALHKWRLIKQVPSLSEEGFRTLEYVDQLLDEILNTIVAMDEIQREINPWVVAEAELEEVEEAQVRLSF